MASDEQELTELFRRTISGTENVGDGSKLYRDGIGYQPSFFMRQSDKGEGKLELKTTTPELLHTAPELNPSHLTEQGVDSYIDSTTQNVVFTLPEGTVRMGFYDRAKAELANAQPNGDSTEGLVELVNGTDKLLPKLNLAETQPLVSNLIGKSFPPMFNYRSVVFERDTTYGLVVDVDASVLGHSEEFTDVMLDAEFIKEHPTDMNFLFPLIVRASHDKGLQFDNLILSGSMDTGDALSYLHFLNKKQYETRLSYERTPQLSVTARLNGVPVGLSVYKPNGKPEFREIGFRGRHVGNSHVAVVSRGFIQNEVDHANSVEGDLLYQVISRDESVVAASENLQFGILDVQLMKGYQISGFDIVFEKVVEDTPLHEEIPFREEDALKSLTFGPTRGYTAGRSTVGQLKKATIETVQFAFERVLLRDAFTLVHAEQVALAPEYTSTTHSVPT